MPISIHFILARPGGLGEGHGGSSWLYLEQRLMVAGFEIEGVPDLVVGRQVAGLRQKAEG
jgi:hypothetical protein